VLVFAPRIPPRLLRALIRLDDRSVPIAETYRRLGEEADRLGVTRPSYERIRELVHRFRLIRYEAGVVRARWKMAVRARVRGLELFFDYGAAIGVRRRE
jgi:hypothetical protein